MHVRPLNQVVPTIPTRIDARTYNFGLREYLITIDIDPVPGTNNQRYAVDLRVYGLNDIDLTITRYQPGQFQEHEINFGGPHASIVLEYWDGKAAHPGISEKEAQKLGLYYGVAYNNYYDHWGEEHPLLGPTMHSDVRNSEHFTAVWIGGTLADKLTSPEEGINTQFWLYCIAQALAKYRTTGAGVDDAFNQLMNAEFGNEKEGN